MVFNPKKLGILLHVLILFVPAFLEGSVVLDDIKFQKKSINVYNPKYSNLVRALALLNHSLARQIANQLRTHGSIFESFLSEGPDGSGFRIITERDGFYISLDNQTIDQLLSSDLTVQATLKSIISKQWNEYREKNLSKNRVKILEIIKDLAPELYTKITEFDVDGSQHLVIGDGLAVRNNYYDGLPVIEINNDFFDDTPGVQKAGIAHELGHYALEHIVIRDTTYNQGSGELFNRMASHATKDTKIAIGAKKSLDPNRPTNIDPDRPRARNLDPEKAMVNAYVRTYEYEADRFAMVTMGVDYQDVESMVASWNDSTKGCATFGVDHPLDKDRLKQFEGLKDEVALHKASSSLKAPVVNWDNVQYDTLKYYSGFYDYGYLNYGNEFKDVVKKYLPKMVSQAQADIDERLAQLRKEPSLFRFFDSEYDAKNEPLSTKDWVNIHRVLLVVDNKVVIEELQSCEAVHGSCITKGTSGSGVQIIPENLETGTHFSISFDQKSLNKINSHVADITATITDACNKYAPPSPYKMPYKAQKEFAVRREKILAGSQKTHDLIFGGEQKQKAHEVIETKVESMPIKKSVNLSENSGIPNQEAVQSLAVKVSPQVVDIFKMPHAV